MILRGVLLQYHNDGCSVAAALQPQISTERPRVVAGRRQPVACAAMLAFGGEPVLKDPSLKPTRKTHAVVANPKGNTPGRCRNRVLKSLDSDGNTALRHTASHHGQSDCIDGVLQEIIDVFLQQPRSQYDLMLGVGVKGELDWLRLRGRELANGTLSALAKVDRLKGHGRGKIRQDIFRVIDKLQNKSPDLFEALLLRRPVRSQAAF